ncbi:class I SAM-dependent methyltransferase [Oceanicola sp. S124]|uniref:class I SAM-dependent methyltransferase n=1 Tax=Oceanicola sp. S124 TaxID=1042378 RepID=UPI000255A1A1|nr:class I SAM-dependent methyltransferase [Oceanicola sp. S124]
MNETGNNGWENSAQAWIDSQQDQGDFSRAYILDRAMLERIGVPSVTGSEAGPVLDLGCGEGRFCRLLSAQGHAVTGIEPTPSLLARARSLDPQGRYVRAGAEALPFADASFGLVISYLTLIDIDDIGAAIAEAARVLRPGGRLLIANINPFCTAGAWQKDGQGRSTAFAMDRYLEERAEWVSWAGIEIRNWHRPMTLYMQLLLGAGLQLVHFDEPAPHGGPAERVEKYTRVPWFHVMEWVKPVAVASTPPVPI